MKRILSDLGEWCDAQEGVPDGILGRQKTEQECVQGVQG